MKQLKDHHLERSSRKPFVDIHEYLAHASMSRRPRNPVPGCTTPVHNPMPVNLQRESSPTWRNPRMILKLTLLTTAAAANLGTFVVGRPPDIATRSSSGRKRVSATPVIRVCVAKGVGRCQGARRPAWKRRFQAPPLRESVKTHRIRGLNRPARPGGDDWFPEVLNAAQKGGIDRVLLITPLKNGGFGQRSRRSFPMIPLWNALSESGFAVWLLRRC